MDDYTEYKLPKGGSLVMIDNVLDTKEQLDAYMTSVKETMRHQYPSAFGHQAPRLEIHYNDENQEYNYSKIKHHTIGYPKHVNEMLETAQKKLKQWMNMETLKRDQGVDIEYGPTHKRGGSIAAHSDDEDQWTHVIVYSIGQERRMIFRDKKTKEKIYELPLKNNSIILMNGQEVQKYYTHEVPKLGACDIISQRWSLNVRYK